MPPSLTQSIGDSLAVAAPQEISAGTTDSLRSCWPLDDARLRWYAYARVAWWHLLKSLGPEPGDNILMPDLICDVMTEPLRRLGLEARYYTSEPLKPIAVSDLRRHLDHRTRAVLAVHYFGFPAELSGIAAYCGEMGVPLIEDASQSLLTRDEQCPIGQHGSAVLFSFRKTLHLPHGAGVLCNDPKLAEMMERTPADLSKPRRDVWRYWVKCIDRRWLGGNLERLLDAMRTRHIAGGKNGDNGHAAVDPFDPCLVQASRSARWLTLNSDMWAEAQRRRELFAQLASRWNDEKLPGRPMLTELPDGWVPYAFVLEPETVGVEETCGLLQMMGLAAEPWPRLSEDVPVDVAGRRKVLLIL